MVYILPMSNERHTLLKSTRTLREAVPKTRETRGETVIILHGNEFTHVALGTIAKSHITLTDVHQLSRPLQWLEMPLIIPVRLRNHARRIFTTGGRLPPKTGQAILAALVHLAPETKARLAK